MVGGFEARKRRPKVRQAAACRPAELADQLGHGGRSWKRKACRNLIGRGDNRPGPTPHERGPRLMNALHQKYRPQPVRQLVGQEAICGTLRNALLAEPIAPAYCFPGGPAGHRQALQCPDPGPFAELSAASAAPTPEPAGVCEGSATRSPAGTPSMLDRDRRGSNTRRRQLRADERFPFRAPRPWAAEGPT